MDKIIIKNLRVRGIIGVNPEERVIKQDILVNITMYADVRRAAATDDIGDAVSYSDVARRVKAHVEAASDFLVEKLATDIAGIILNEFGVERVKVRVEKPTILPFADAVGVEIERSRSDFA
jgi:FolB domain-containing protein